MTITVRLFAVLRDLAGFESASLTLAEGATVSDAVLQVRLRCPRAARVLERCRFAVNAELAGADHPLAAGDEVALLPPVTGG
jgi:molybdopterin converting factor subunit 1